MSSCSKSNSSPSRTLSHPKLSERLRKQIGSWCATNGLVYSDGTPVNWTPAPLSCLPQAMRRDHFLYLQEIQSIWNGLVDKIARNRPFLQKELSFITANVDPFTSRLLEIYNSLPEEQIKESKQLGIFRSDYMIDEGETGEETQEKEGDTSATRGKQTGKPLQIEINTISSSFASLSYKVHQLQDFLLQRNMKNADFKEICEYLSYSCSVSSSDPFNLPTSTLENHSLPNLAKALAAAHECYLKDNEQGMHERGSRIVFIVQQGERNVS
jgi:hypothetical protein